VFKKKHSAPPRSSAEHFPRSQCTYLRTYFLKHTPITCTYYHVCLHPGKHPATHHLPSTMLHHRNRVDLCKAITTKNTYLSLHGTPSTVPPYYRSIEPRDPSLAIGRINAMWFWRRSFCTRSPCPAWHGTYTLTYLVHARSAACIFGYHVARR